MIYVERIRNNVLEKYIPGTHHKELIIPEGIEVIGTGLCSPGEAEYLKDPFVCENWDECFEVQKIYIPASVKEIRPAAFMSIAKLESFEVEETCTAAQVIDDALLSKDGKTLICYPSAKEGNYIVPNGVEIIGENAFYWTCLETITLPESVKRIEDDAFSGGFSLKCVHIPVTITEIWERIFEYCDEPIIKSSKGSYAIQYAKENGIKYEEI